MGNTSSPISIVFDRAQPSIYFAGETITGQVLFMVSKPTARIDEIFLRISGDVGYTTTRTARIQNGQTERITDCHDVRILSQRITLGVPIALQQCNMRPSNGNKSSTAEMIEPGEYKYPFSFRLPDVLPPTLHPENYPFVRYHLQVLIEKKWYCADSHHLYPLRVYPRVNLLHISNSQRALKFDTKRKDITVKGILPRSGFIPGERVNVSLEIHNLNRISIKHMDVCLVQRYEIDQCRRRLELVRFSVAEVCGTNDEFMQATCPITIPQGIAPSYAYESRNSRVNVLVNVFYDLRVEMKAKGLFTDFDLLVPIIIGTDCSTEHSQENFANNSYRRSNNVSGRNSLSYQGDIGLPTYESMFSRQLPTN